MPSSPTSIGIQERMVANVALQEPLAIVMRRHARARRYTLRLNREGELVVTIPRGGSRRAALGFVERSRAWIERQRARRAGAAGHARIWIAGTEILFRGARCVLQTGRTHGRPFVAFADQRIWLADENLNLRRPVEQHLRALARRELPRRVAELARQHRVTFSAVMIRNQASRWGSCSERGAISLNWRLVQAPPEVCDYLITHELMHRREMNHSVRFWRHVAEACPRWREAEHWLDKHALELGF
jgi:predicted metal-dependent hydrolase